MIKKIVFLLDYPFDRRDYDRFGIEILKDNGFSVEVCDLANVYHPEITKYIKGTQTPIFKEHYILSDKGEAMLYLKELNHSCFIINLIFYNLKSLPIYKVISKKNLKYAVFSANTMPFYKAIIKKSKKLIFLELMRKVFNVRVVLRQLNNLKPNKIFNSFFQKISFQTLGVVPASLILAGGEKSLRGIAYPFDKSTKIIWIHQLDYDIYLKERNHENGASEEIVVFLDEYLPFHPDYLYMDIPPFCKPEEYYPNLLKFFDFIESKLALKVVIAAHPRSNYEDHAKLFGRHAIIKGKTAELIGKSRFVIAHASNSINYAILFGKPIIFTTTSGLCNSPEGTWIRTLASLLGKEVHNLSEKIEIDLDEECKVNEKLYSEFRNNYIKITGSSELSFWQIVSDYLKEYVYN